MNAEDWWNISRKADMRLAYVLAALAGVLLGTAIFLVVRARFDFPSAVSEQPRKILGLIDHEGAIDMVPVNESI